MSEEFMFGDGLRPILSLDTPKFLDFCRDGLRVDGRTIEDLKMQGEIGEDLKYDHVQESYRKDPDRFISMHRDRDWVRRIGTTAYSRLVELPPPLVYKIIASVAHNTPQVSWLQYARETLDIVVKNNDLKFCPRTLSVDQKQSMLHHWIAQQPEDHDAALNRLCRTFHEYQARRRTFSHADHA